MLKSYQCNCKSFVKMSQYITSIILERETVNPELVKQHLIDSYSKRFSKVVSYERIKTYLQKFHIPLNEKQYLALEEKQKKSILNSNIPEDNSLLLLQTLYISFIKNDKDLIIQSMEQTDKKLETKSCIVCLKEKCKLKCSICRNGFVVYCSKECQTKDWKMHKIFCNELSYIWDNEFVHLDYCPLSK